MFFLTKTNTHHRLPLPSRSNGLWFLRILSNRQCLSSHITKAVICLPISFVKRKDQEVELQCSLLCFLPFCFSFWLLWLPVEKVTKICDSSGNWFRHPESNRTWTNYTQCNIYTHEKVKVGKEQMHVTSLKEVICETWKIVACTDSVSSNNIS